MTPGWAPTARVVLVETADELPGLLPAQAWSALQDAATVWCRDPETHPFAPYLEAVGIELRTLEPAALERGDLDLSMPGAPDERRLAKGLLQTAVADGEAVYLLGPDDAALPRVVGLKASDHDAETEFVFLAPSPRGLATLRLVEVMGRLRDPDGGCPWDLQQDHRSLVRYLLEETYELVDAIEAGDDADLAEELGDVLLQVVFHAQVAADRDAFDIDRVASGIADKLIRRHPHVFGDGDARTAADVQANWDRLKDEEKGRTGPFDGVPTALPSLALADKLQRKAAKRGFDWRDHEEPAARVREELDEVLTAADPDEQAAEIGDLLGAVVGLARHLGVDAELALRHAAATFRRRFEAALDAAEAAGLATADLDREGWLELWSTVKADERADGPGG